MKFRRNKPQTGRAAGAVVASPPLGKRAGAAGLVQRVKGALVRRSVTKAVESVPVAALAVGVAIGVVLGAFLMLTAIAAAARAEVN